MKKTCKQCAGRKKYVVTKFSGQYIADCELCTDPAILAAKEKAIQDTLDAIFAKKPSSYGPKYNEANYTYKKAVKYKSQMKKDYLDYMKEPKTGRYYDDGYS